MIQRIASITVFLFMLLAAGGAKAQTKIDPYLEIPGSGKAVAIKASRVPSPESRVPSVDVFIKTSDPQRTRASIEAAGGIARMAVGDIMTASVDAGAIEEIAAGDEVVFIEAGKPVHIKNDAAAADINGTEVHAGTQLPATYTGRGAIVGLVDTGIDYDHPDFKDADGKNRILAIWNQNRSGGPAPGEMSSGYGTECGAESIADGTCPLKDFEGHGTHIAGTMAGRNETYGGVAPDANIVAVVYDSSLDLGSGYAETIFSTKICEAAYYVFTKAASLGMPAVVNLSLGTHIGPHDGTSLFEQCLANLVKGSAGRAIVAAAGNEHSTDATYTGIHAGYDVDGTSATNFVIRKASRDRIYYIDLWGAQGSDLSVGLALRDGPPSGDPDEHSEAADPGGTMEGSFLGGKIGYLINATETRSALNGKPHVGIRITLDPSISQPSKYSFDLVISGKGSFDAWLFPDKPTHLVDFTSVSGSRGADWTYVAGDRVKNVAIPATSPDIIAVAAYTTRNQWDGGAGCCQVPYELGNLLDFSSFGPSAAPSATGVKPDLAAPGGMIASALSSDALPDGRLVIGGTHVLQAGTSMASPFVSGTIALMYSANPNFTHEDVKGYIVQSAYADEMVGEVPNDRWGHGKLDVLAAVEAAINGGASGSFDANEDVSPPPSGGGSSNSSCALVNAMGPPGTAPTMSAFILLVLIALAAGRTRHRSRRNAV